MSQELTTIDSGALSADMLAALGFGGGAVDLKPSRLELVHKSKKEKVAGTFHDEQSNMAFESMDLIVLKFQKAKVLFDSDELGAKPLCKTGRYPINADPKTMFPLVGDQSVVRQDKGKGCAKCEMNQWKVINGKKIKPPCADTRQLLVMDANTGIPYYIQFKRSSVTAINNLYDSINKYVAVARAKGAPVTPLHIQVNMSVNALEGKKGDYFNPYFGKLSGASKDSVLQAFELAKRFVLAKVEDEDDEQNEVNEAISNAVSNAVQSASDDLPYTDEV